MQSAVKGCDPCLLQYQVQGDPGSELPGLLTNNKAILTKGVPNKSGHMQMDKQGTQFYLIYSYSTRGTKTAKVEGQWLPSK